MVAVQLERGLPFWNLFTLEKLRSFFQEIIMNFLYLSDGCYNHCQLHFVGSVLIAHMTLLVCYDLLDVSFCHYLQVSKFFVNIDEERK